MVASAGGHGSLIGATLGEYEVVALIGRGAMGSVYLARDTKLNRLVALKVLLGSLARTPSLVKQFHQEAQSAAPLNHPGIVRIYSAGMADGTPYIAMEYVDGEPLDRFLKRKGKLKWDVALHIGGKLALALDCAHHHRIIHRDIKPSNIMLDHAGNIRLTDFGIASIQSDEPGGGGDSFVGTPQYMSPEQVTGKGVGPSSDLYALGVVLYQMMANDLPFKGESSVALIKNICTEEAPRLNKLDPEIPDDVARLVAYLMEKEPKNRPANAKVVHGLMNRLQRKKGGGSVLSESLDSFIRDETEPRPFSNVYQKSSAPGKSRKNAAKKTSSTSESSFSWDGLLRVGLVASLAAIAFSVGPIWGKMQRVTEIREAPVLVNSTIRAVSPGVQVVELDNNGYEYAYVSWIGREPAVLVGVGGKPGRLSQGSRGLLAVDLAAREVRSVHPPMSQTLDGNFDEARAASIRHVSIPNLPATSPFHGSFVTHVTDDRSGHVLALAHAWTEREPRPQVMYRAKVSEWNGRSDEGDNGGSYSRAVLHPDGNLMCMVMMDADMRYPYIAEALIAEGVVTGDAIRRTTPGSDIISESVRYSDDGAYIFYLRRRATGNAELWRMSSNSDEENGRRVVTTLDGGAYSVSPDGRHGLAVSNEGRTRSADIVLFQIPSGLEEARYGPGQISDYAWHPSGRYAVAIQTKGDALPQLVALESQEPYRSAPVTMVNKGMGGAYAVSPDGRRVASVAGSSAMPSLLVLEWEALDVETKLNAMETADLRSGD